MFVRKGRIFFLKVLWVTMAAGRPCLVREGKPCAEIVIAPNPPRAVTLAAAELRTYLEKMTGADLPITTEPGGAEVQVYVGRSSHADSLGVNDEGLRHGAYRMVSGPHWLALVGHDADFAPPPDPWPRNHADRKRAYDEWDAITGRHWDLPYPLRSIYKSFHDKGGLKISEYDDRGSLNAVYAYLRELGIRWYMPGEDNEIVPRTDSITLPQMGRTVRPDFPVRWWHVYYNRFNAAPRDEVLWQLRLGLHRGQDLTGLGCKGHGTVWVISREETKAKHPEYYALWGVRSTKGTGKPCLSAPGLFADNVDWARAMYDQYQVPWVSVMPSDGYSFLCQCALCKGLDTPERGARGRLSDYVWGYVDRVAHELARTHPDRKVCCHAYGTYLLPPLEIDKLSSNVVVGLCQWRSLAYDPATRREMLDIRAGWRRKMAPDNRFILWEYYLHARPNAYGWDGIPVVFPRLIAEDLRSLKGLSLGEYVEIYRRPGEKNALDLALNHLNLYVTAALYWDVNQDIDALLDEYYRLFYGPAEREARAFFEFCEANWFKMKSDVGTVHAMLDLLEAARGAAGDTVHGARLERIAAYTAPLRERAAQVGAGGDKTYVNRGSVPRRHALEGRVDEIVLDGKLGDPIWKDQPKFLLVDCVTGARRDDNQSIAKIAWAGDALYVALRCYDNDMANLCIGTRESDDFGLWWGDFVDILIETHHHAHYQIGINSAGVLADADRKDGFDLNWSSGAEVAVQHEADRWTAEVRIPIIAPPTDKNDLLQGVDADPAQGVVGVKPTSALPWYFNLCRQRVRQDEAPRLDAFSPTGTPAFHERTKFAELFIQ